MSLDNDKIVIENNWETRISIPILTFILLLLWKRSIIKNSSIDHRQNRAYICATLSRAHRSHLIYTLVLLNRIKRTLKKHSNDTKTNQKVYALLIGIYILLYSKFSCSLANIVLLSCHSNVYININKNTKSKFMKKMIFCSIL